MTQIAEAINRRQKLTLQDTNNVLTNYNDLIFSTQQFNIQSVLGVFSEFCTGSLN